MKADVIIIGDSHSVALKKGCDALGINAVHLWTNGAAWHDGLFRPHRQFGLWSPRRWVNERITQARETLGVENIATTGLPILGTIGFHLGRLVTPFGWVGHQVYADGMAPPDSGLVASTQFLEDYLTKARVLQFRTVRSLLRSAPVTLFPPPRATAWHNSDMFRAMLCVRLGALGAKVIDPSYALGGPEGIVPPEMLEDDQSHGNEAYGIAALKLAGF